MKNKFLIIILSAFLFKFSCSDYVEIPKDSIRIRVIGPSNSNLDQKNKMIVVNLLNREILKLNKTVSSWQDLECKIKSHKSEIAFIVREKLKEKGINEKIKVSYGYNYFPEKKYKNVIYGAGNYKSFVIKIGQAKGKNYWCAIYPSICLLKKDKPVYKYHFLIKDILSKYN